MSNWKTKNSALDLDRWSPSYRFICTLLTASHPCVLSLYLALHPKSQPPPSISCVFTSLSPASSPSEPVESQLTLAMSQLSQINVFVPHKSVPACRLCSQAGKQNWRCLLVPPLLFSPAQCKGTCKTFANPKLCSAWNSFGYEARGRRIKKPPCWAELPKSMSDVCFYL